MGTIVASLLAMFAIFVVVTLAQYVVPIVIVGGVTWVVLVIWLRKGRAVSTEPAASARTEPARAESARTEPEAGSGRTAGRGGPGNLVGIPAHPSAIHVS
jgi:hypothetical protein